MRRQTHSRRITVEQIDYRWRATGNDGYICVGIWPAHNIGASIHGTMGYHETAKDQIVVTNRLVRRIIEYAIVERHYDPQVKVGQLHLRNIDELIRWDDAVRAAKP